MTNRLEMGKVCSGMTTGFQPLIDCTFSLPGSGQMMSQQFRLAFDEIREFLF